jgi:hypothetical protein
MIDEPPARFLMTPAQHLQWAAILRRKGKPEKARRHERSRGDRDRGAGGLAAVATNHCSTCGQSTAAGLPTGRMTAQ